MSAQLVDVVLEALSGAIDAKTAPGQRSGLVTVTAAFTAGGIRRLRHSLEDEP